MTIKEMLLEMKAAEATVFLYSTMYSDDWTCSFEYSKTKGFEIKFQEEGDDPEEAVLKCYDRWKAIGSGGVKEIAPKLLTPPETEDEKWARRTREYPGETLSDLNDEVPF